MLDWKSRSRTFETIAAFTPDVGSMVVAGRDGNAETVSRQWVTAGIFDVLGVMPIAGRTLFPDQIAAYANTGGNPDYTFDQTSLGSQVLRLDTRDGRGALMRSDPAG
jgi:hypothetical protein